MSQGPRGDGKSRPIRIGIAAALAALVLVVYWPAGDLAFISYDDPEYVTKNREVQAGLTGATLRWALSAKVSSNWHPLTVLSHALDCEMFGLNPRGHHLTSVALHATGTVLLFTLLLTLTGSTFSSALAAALFGVHPLNVESVAWIAERKNVLSTVFFLLTCLAYVAWTRRGGRRRYAVMTVLFALGLMTKPMLVTLPLVLLLLDRWPLERMRGAGFTPATRSGEAMSSLLTEKVPLFALSFTSGLLTLWSQQDAINTLDMISLGDRVSNAAISYVKYLSKALWPADLAVFYPREDLATWPAVAATGILLGVTAVVLAAVRRFPYLTTGWLWYVVTLFPVIGVVPVGMQAMADRYAYLTLVGIFWMASHAATLWAGSSRSRRAILGSASVVILLALASTTRAQLARWSSSLTLFEHTIRVTGPNATAENNLGVALADVGRFDEAMTRFQRAVEIQPTNPDARSNLGAALVEAGRFDEAVPHLIEGVRRMPGEAWAHLNLGAARANQGHLDDAVVHFSKAIELDPYDDFARQNLALALSLRDHALRPASGPSRTGATE